MNTAHCPHVHDELATSPSCAGWGSEENSPCGRRAPLVRTGNLPEEIWAPGPGWSKGPGAREGTGRTDRRCKSLPNVKKKQFPSFGYSCQFALFSMFRRQWEIYLIQSERLALRPHESSHQHSGTASRTQTRSQQHFLEVLNGSEWTHQLVQDPAASLGRDGRRVQTLSVPFRHFHAPSWWPRLPGPGALGPWATRTCPDSGRPPLPLPACCPVHEKRAKRWEKAIPTGDGEDTAGETSLWERDSRVLAGKASSRAIERVFQTVQRRSEATERPESRVSAQAPMRRGSQGPRGSWSTRLGWLLPQQTEVS